MNIHTDMNGIWSGRYEYFGRGEAVKFTAWFDDQNGTLSGTIMEPNSFVPGAGEELQSSISGARHALEVEFTKTYDATSGAHDRPIVYSGSVDKDFTLLRGVWVFPDDPQFQKGQFEMSRASVSIEHARLHGLLMAAAKR